ncbi:HU family DNA-binding protein [Kineococcus radiotolerans]|uniref:Histone family protein DNA-binding protein n=1 Tax=Kineococcus radiotolerans (strain ATCC BAA-149 / DSM 14245 / SRS30216) TaxID=266940 RepID=A6WAH8_KINRD|nr:HU family DNA-binding protein [Kineococcus radiotolerans]ABS03817.1 histone family protein DNA-binding protein [Kineococcus radiotolerans SRS30216 = ATCC BAA-149]
MNKAEMVDALETRLGGRKEATTAVEAVIELIQLTVAKGDKIAISGFGTFEKQVRNARTGRNPRTGEAVKIKKTSVPRFRPGTAFKEVVSDTKALRAYQAELKAKATGTAPAAKTAAAKTTTPARTASGTRTTSAAGTAATKTAAKSAPARTTAAAKKAAPTTRTTAAASKSAPAKTTTRRVAKKA